jgi:hypothetical protein
MPASESVHLAVERLGSPDAEWNARLTEVAEGSWRQSTYYGEYRRAFWLEEPVYLVARTSTGAVAGQLLAFFGHPLGWGLHRRGLSFLSPACRAVYPIFYWFEGPVAFAPSLYDPTCDTLIGWMVQAGRERGCVSGRAIPSYYGRDFVSRQAALRRVFAARGFAETPKATMVVDLREDVETLHRSLAREARTKIRKALGQGVEIVEITNNDAGIDMLYHAMRETSIRNGVAALSRRGLRRSSWSRYCGQGFSKGFVSMHQGHLVSSQLAVLYNGIMHLGGVSYTDYSRANRVYGNDLMQWHMIQWGKAQGMGALDFMGIAPNSPSPKMRAIYEFKSKWGGRELEFGEYVISYPSLRGRVVDRLASWRGYRGMAKGEGEAGPAATT